MEDRPLHGARRARWERLPQLQRLPEELKALLPVGDAVACEARDRGAGDAAAARVARARRKDAEVLLHGAHSLGKSPHTSQRHGEALVGMLPSNGTVLRRFPYETNFHCSIATPLA